MDTIVLVRFIQELSYAAPLFDFHAPHPAALWFVIVLQEDDENIVRIVRMPGVVDEVDTADGRHIFGWRIRFVDDGDFPLIRRPVHHRTETDAAFIRLLLAQLHHHIRNSRKRNDLVPLYLCRSEDFKSETALRIDIPVRQHTAILRRIHAPCVQQARNRLIYPKQADLVLHLPEIQLRDLYHKFPLPLFLDFPAALPSGLLHESITLIQHPLRRIHIRFLVQKNADPVHLVHMVRREIPVMIDQPLDFLRIRLHIQDLRHALPLHMERRPRNAHEKPVPFLRPVLAERAVILVNHPEILLLRPVPFLHVRKKPAPHIRIEETILHHIADEILRLLAHAVDESPFRRLHLEKRIRHTVRQLHHRHRHFPAMDSDNRRQSIRLRKSALQRENAALLLEAIRNRRILQEIMRPEHTAEVHKTSLLLQTKTHRRMRDPVL